jgi:hypothetical protein
LFWLHQAVVFLLACLTTAVLMRLLVRGNDLQFNALFGFLSLAISVKYAWSSLRQWRYIAPIRSATVLGLCAGVGGAGLFIVVVRSILYLFPSYIGPAAHV